jgi:ribonuclease D
MLHYAVDDVRYLLELADRLVAQLQSKNRIDWFHESCGDLRAAVAARTVQPKEDPWRVQGSGKLGRKGLALLKSLWTWRETIAKERDVPCFRIISNKQLLDAAIAFEAGKGVQPPAGWRPKWKRDFELALEAVTQEDEDTWPQHLRPKGNRLSEAARSQLDKLCEVRETRARELDLEPSLLGARSTLEGVVGHSEGVEELLGWQRSVFGESLDTARKALGFDQ